MAEKKPFYITTTIPYVNAEPHIGFAMEIIQADIIARYKELVGFEVFFNTGTDEHGQKVYKASLAEGKDPQSYCDELSEKFRGLVPLLGLKNDIHFIRTTDVHHKAAAQEMWKKVEKAGFIEKKFYKIKYCVGCELEKTDSELVDGHCPLHPDKELEEREEENYFFKFSAFGDKLLALYEANPDIVIPNYRLNEMKALIGRGLEDFSISRLKEKMPWGVPVPGDEAHVMYVWFDALVNYISTIGWPEDEAAFEKFWKHGTPVQVAGKDQVRQQAAMWQAMLIAADLPPTQNIVIHGFLNFGGQKMSKSLGNVVSPQDVVSEFGTEALRYFVAREFNQFEDTDISIEKLKESYNANLANGLGNLAARIMKLAEEYLPEPVDFDERPFEALVEAMDKFEIQKAANVLWGEIAGLDVFIQDAKPWASKDPEVISNIARSLSRIALSLQPLMPETSKKILDAIKVNKKPENLFQRKD